MRISVRIDSKAAQAQLRRWGGEFREKVQKAVARGIASEAAELKQDVRSHVAGQMAVVKKSFVKGFTAKVLDKDKNRLPALYVGSRIPWSGIHERGGVIGGRMLIPLHGRVGRKRFKAQIAELMRGGNAYFIKNAKGEPRADGREHQRTRPATVGLQAPIPQGRRHQEVEARRGRSHRRAGATRAA